MFMEAQRMAKVLLSAFRVAECAILSADLITCVCCLQEGPGGSPTDKFDG